MAKKGEPFTEEEERNIELSVETRVRAHNRIKADERKEKCDSGEHVFKDGKCKYCQAEEPQPEPEGKGKGWNPY